MKPREPRWALFAALGVLLLIPLYLFLPALFMGKAVFGYDARVSDLPFKAVIQHALAAGEAPLWMPEICGGMPGIASSNFHFFYPTELLRILLKAPLQAGFAWDAAFHVLLAGVGMLLFLRAVGLSLGASLLGAVFYAMSGSEVSGNYGGYYNFTKGVALLPWAFWGAWRGWQERRWSGWGVAGLALGLQVLAVATQLYAYALPALAAFILALAWKSPRPAGTPAPWARAAGAIALVTGLSVLVAAPQLFLTAQYVPYSVRQSGDLAFFNDGALGLPEALTWLVPGYFGWRQPTYHGYMNVSFMTTYLGVAPWALAAAGLAASWRRRWLGAWMAGLALLAFLLAVGPAVNLHRLFFHLPVYSGFRIWSRILFLVSFAVACLAALGWDAFREDGRRAFRWAAAFCAAGLLVSALAWRHPGPDAGDLRRTQAVQDQLAPIQDVALELSQMARSSAQRSLLLLGAIAALLWLAQRRQRWGLALAALLCLHIADQGAALRRFLIFEEPGLRLEAVATARELLPPSLLGEWRSFSMIDSLPNDAVLYGNQTVLGRHSMQMRSFNAIQQAMASRPGDWLDLWSVRWLLRPVAGKSGAAGAERVERQHVLPRARLLTKARVVNGDEEAYRLLADPAFDFRGTALVAEELSLPGGPAKGSVRWLERSSNAYSLDVEAGQESLLLLAENWYPSWRCKLDGASVPLLRANGGMQAVRVGAGRHRLEFEFDAGVFDAGLLAAGLGILLIGGLFWRDRGQKRAANA